LQPSKNDVEVGRAAQVPELAANFPDSAKPAEEEEQVTYPYAAPCKMSLRCTVLAECWTPTVASFAPGVEVRVEVEVTLRQSATRKLINHRLEKAEGRASNAAHGSTNAKWNG
jgi:hypothetical protein